jgi:glycosyltransferase involved in cell wall biosynthesis
MEALSSGCRLLTTDLPGACEILGDHLSDMVDLVRLPPLETVDTPFDRDWPALERDLAQALDRVIRKAVACRQPDPAQSDKICQAYTWEKVFSRMASVYEQISL